MDFGQSLLALCPYWVDPLRTRNIRVVFVLDLDYPLRNNIIIFIILKMMSFFVRFCCYKSIDIIVYQIKLYNQI